MGDIFERLCPHYMLYGMSYKEYWYGDPWSLKAYKTAYLLRQRQENTMLWLQGAYTLDAFSTVIANSFSKKGTPPKKYMEKPLDIFPKTKAEEEAEMEQKQKELIQKLTAWKKTFDASKKQNT